MKEELKTCPFCGEIPKYVDYTGKNPTDNPKHFIECSCGAEINAFTKEVAVMSWNTRHGELEPLDWKKVQEVIFSHCVKSGLSDEFRIGDIAKEIVAKFGTPKVNRGKEING